MVFRKLVLRAMGSSGLYSILRHRRKGAIAMAYHGVEEEIIDPRIQTVHIPLRRFRRHMDYIKKNFEVIALDDLSERLEAGRGLDGRQVVLTFDDGYRNNLEVVAPLMESLDLPFAVFVSTEHTGQGVRMPTYRLRAGIYLTEAKSCRIRGFPEPFDLRDERARDHAIQAIAARYKTAPQPEADAILEDVESLIPEERWSEIDARFASDTPMNWEEVEILHRRGVTIGSHGRRHVILHTGQDEAWIRDEVRLSREEVERRLGSCRYFAYPNGTSQDIAPVAADEVVRSGYELAFTAEFGEIRQDTDRRLLPRVDGDDGFEYLQFYLNTAYRPGRGG